MVSVRRAVILLAACSLLASLLGTPAVAAKKAKPVKTTLYMHGTYPVGDVLELVNFVETSQPMKMDTAEPAGPAPKSMSYFGQANEQCAGNPFWPSWEGQVAGTIVGDVKVYINALAAPSTAKLRLWTDIPFSSCTASTTGAADFKEPQLQQDVEIPPGVNEVQVVFKNVRIPVGYNMVAQIHSTSPGAQGRVLYDSPDFATRIEFNCIPKSGKACA